jgi:hypothetical protein
MRSINKPIYAYFGHHKCGTSWINSILAESCKIMGLRFSSVHNPRQFNENLSSYIKNNKIDFISYTNANHIFASDIKNLTGFHVIRDPRDLAVSAYFSHFHSHPTHDWPLLKAHRPKLREVEKDTGLLMDMEFSKGVYFHISSWDYTQAGILELKMENMIKNPYEIFPEIFEFMGLLERISLPKLLKVVYQNRFAAKTGGRRQNEEDLESHYRKGVTGDWRNHFQTEHKEYFKNKYGDLLIKLGYETDMNWD